MGYMGDWYKKALQPRSKREAFKHRKRYENSEATLKDANIVEYPIPTESIIKPESKATRIWRIIRVILVLLGIIFSALLIISDVANHMR